MESSSMRNWGFLPKAIKEMRLLVNDYVSRANLEVDPPAQVKSLDDMALHDTISETN